WRNPYDKRFRIYEKFNETLDDIFTLEALEYLHNNDIYMLEPREIVQLDCQDKNTYMAAKKLLFPLLEKFREEVIEAKINVNPSILTQCIGEDNYEALVDAVNKVDYLCRKDRKSTRLNSSHVSISYAVFCLKKKNIKNK